MGSVLVAGAGERGGFTLLELVIVLSLFALAVAISLPSAASLRRAGETAAAAREMLLLLKAARWKAIVSGSARRLATFSRRGDSALWYVIEREEGAVWIPQGDAHRLPEGVRMAATGEAVKHFTPRGTSSMGSIVLEGERGESYRLSFNPATGRVRLYRGEAEVGYDR